MCQIHTLQPPPCSKGSSIPSSRPSAPISCQGSGVCHSSITGRVASVGAGAGQRTLMSGLLTVGTRLTTIRNGNRRGSWCPLSPPRGCFSAPGDLMWAPYSAPPSLTTRLCIYRIFYPGSSKSSITRWQVQLSLFYGRRSPVQGGKGEGSRLLEPARAPGTVCGSPAETDSPRNVLVGDCALVIAVPPRLLQCPAPHECPINMHQVPA